MTDEEEQMIAEVEGALEGKKKLKPMTVADLREALKGVPGDMPVVVGIEESDLTSASVCCGSIWLDTTEY